MKRQIRGKKRWVVRWLDARKGKGKAGQRQIICENLGATNEVLRKQLLNQYKEKEKKIKQDVELFGISEIPGEKSLSFIINEYLQNRENEVKIRDLQGGRNGISKNTFRVIITSMNFFTVYIKKKKLSKCKDLTPLRLQEFRNWLQLQKGDNVEYRSPHSLNRTLRNIKTFLNSYRLDNTFNNVDSLISVIKTFPTNSELPFHFKVKDLQLVLQSALILDTEQCTMTREKHYAGVSFEGSLPLKNAPLFPLLVLAMLTGMRKGEMLNFTWDNVDLDSGILKVLAQKTGRARIIPLVDNVHGIISPELVQLLRIWKLKVKDKYVLPHPLSENPTEMKHPLERFKKQINLSELTFQNLRKNFVSFVVSFGVSPTIAAFWAGHSPAVAEKHYMQFAYDRLKGETLADSMGISDILRDAIAGFNGKGQYKNLSMIKWAS